MTTEQLPVRYMTVAELKAEARSFGYVDGRQIDSRNRPETSADMLRREAIIRELYERERR